MKSSLAAIAGFAGQQVIGSTDGCGPTVFKGDGPFYPLKTIPAIFDLTAASGETGKAKGQLLYVFGQILDTRCRPVSEARVEIWQADPNGRYNHEGDRKEIPLDPSFSYFGHLLTGPDGAYLFKTIVPGKYRFSGFVRTPHIHFKIKSADYKLLSTEMYFKGDEAIMEDDPVFLSASEEKRAPLIVEKQSPTKFPEMAHDFESDALCCRFDLTLRSTKREIKT